MICKKAKVREDTVLDKLKEWKCQGCGCTGLEYVNWSFSLKCDSWILRAAIANCIYCSLRLIAKDIGVTHLAIAAEARKLRGQQ